ncbi:hypothetical protein CSX04_08153 [Burkholderia cepacia]|nr:hypothetical protein CSX04_08153 [Burkholderia cepacia]
MFGISPLGWIHTLGSLPAIPMAVYMFARYGRIVPRSVAGRVYFVTMLIGSLTVFAIAHQGISYGIGIGASCCYWLDMALRICPCPVEPVSTWKPSV